jgi:threonine/homoserine/homoserine lactone efflux protein
VTPEDKRERTALSASLPGTWPLQSRIDVTASGERRVEPSLGDDPVALLIYDRSGHFAAQFMKRDRSVVVPDVPGVAPNNSRARGGYDAYFGTYTVDDAQGTVTQRLLGALSQENVGATLTRAMDVQGDTLIIRLQTNHPDGTAVTRTLIWNRVGRKSGPRAAHAFRMSTPEVVAAGQPARIMKRRMLRRMLRRGLMGELLGPLVLFAAAMCLTPGPNVIMVTASAANFGFRRAVPHMLGITFGFGVMVMAAGFGLAGLFHAEPRLHNLLKYAGATYLLYLAWRIARADAASRDSTRARPINFVEAVLFTWINPKGWVTALGAVVAYTSVGGDVLLQTSVIASVLAAACLASVVIWAWFGVAIARFLGTPRARMAFNVSMAFLLVLSLIPVFR